jgi:hypothetical protein
MFPMANAATISITLKSDFLSDIPDGRCHSIGIMRGIVFFTLFFSTLDRAGRAGSGRDPQMGKKPALEKEPAAQNEEEQ